MTRSGLHFHKIPLVVVQRVDWKRIHLGTGDGAGGNAVPWVSKDRLGEGVAQPRVQVPGFRLSL